MTAMGGDNETLLAVTVAFGVQGLFAGTMLSLAQVVQAPVTDAGVHQMTADAAAIKAGLLVGAAAFLSKSRLVGTLGVAVIAVEWFTYRKAAEMPGAE